MTDLLGIDPLVWRVICMENQKAPSVDEKTAKVLEEMDKSLHNMEQTLGMDHMLVAKICDSYAQILRQNNIRPLDALNMEARAKAIRAKHNQKEAEAQNKGIDIENMASQPKLMSASQVKVLVWVISVGVLAAMGFGVNEMLKWSNLQQAKKEKQAAQARLEAKQNEEAAKMPNYGNMGNTGEQQPINPDKTGEAVEQAVQRAIQNSSPGQVPAQYAGQKSAQQLEYEAKCQKIRDLARQQVQIAENLENSRDFVKASDAYYLVIKEIQANGMPTAAACEDIAKCFDGYGRLAELNARPEVAAECQKNASEVRRMAANNQ